jgi:hypothetical protein
MQTEPALHPPRDEPEQAADAVRATEPGRAPLPTALRSHGELPFGSDFSRMQIPGVGQMIRDTAERGTIGSGGLLPHFTKIQRSFGRHDISHIHAHQGSHAAAAARAIGAHAYTIGDHVAFANSPDLRTVAHEATHVIQQHGGVQLIGGVGEEDDKYEQHADAVAELVVQGRSSEALLDIYTGAAYRQDEEPSTQRRRPPRQVQRKPGDAPAAQGQKVAFNIAFDKPLTREQFIDLTEMTIYGRRVNLTWTGVKDKYEASDSPILAWVPASTLRGRLKDYGKNVSKVIQGIDKVEDAATYQRLNTILQKLTPAQWADFEKRITGMTTNLDDFEKAVDAYLAAQQQREAERVSREPLVTKLYGLETIYQQYRAFLSQLKREQSLAAAAGTTLQAIGASPTLIKMRDDLDAALIQAGFPGGITEFGKFIQDYLIAFRTETVKIGLDILQQYDSVLYKESERYQDPAAVAALHAQLAPLRAAYPEFEKNARIYNEYVRNKERSRVPGSGHLRPKITEEQAQTARQAAEKHMEAARQSVVSISEEFPVLKEEHLPRDRRLDKTALAQANPGQLAALLKSHIESRRHDIKKTRELLATEPEKVFALDNLLAVSLQRQGVDPKSIFGQIVQDKAADMKAREALTDFLLAVFAIALTIVSFGTGIVAVGAAVGAFTLSSILAYQEFREYEAKHAASGTGLLSREPSLVWLIVAVVGAALDLGQAVKAVRAIASLPETLKASSDVARFTEALRALEKKGELDAKIARSVEQAALARAKSAEAAQSLGRTLQSRAYAFPGQLTNPDVYKDVVKLAYYKVKELGYDFLKFADEVRKARTTAKLGDLSSDELALLKKAYEEGKAFASEADLIKYMKRRPLAGKSIVVDENMLIARHKRAKGEGLQAGEKRMVEYLDKNPDAKLSVPEEVYDKVVGKMDTSDLNIIDSTAVRGSADYDAVIKTLEANTVGATKGAEDRRLIADTLFAKAETGTTPAFVTHDPGIYNRLLFMSGKNPAKLGKPVAEAFPDGFEVVINGRKLKVIPVLRK